MLKFEFWYIFETVANVLILFVLLRIFLFKPLNKIINERTQSIQNDIDSAKKAKSEAEELKEQYESTIGDAKEEAKNIIMKAHEDAESERDAIIKKAHEDAEQKVAEADKEIESERKKVLRQAQSEIADLAIEAASKIVGANVDDEKNRHIEGTGLGLSIVKQFVDLMGGRITVNSVYTKGSTFVIEIPQKVVSERSIGEIQIDSSRPHELRGQHTARFEAPEAKVLVVDDNASNLLVVSKLLRETRVQVETVQSGAEALKRTLAEYYHVIFMDHLMPEMDGIECFRAIRTQIGGHCKESKIVALTANAGSENRILYEKEGFDGYLVKPITGDELEKELYRLLPKDITYTAGESEEILKETVSWMKTEQRKKNVAITTESVADLPQELIEKYGIAVLPHLVCTEEGKFMDGIEIETKGLLDYMKNANRKVTTGAPEIQKIEEFFAGRLVSANNILHISISGSLANSGCAAAMEAARAFDNVTVIDSGHLSSGQGLMVIEACRLAEEGLSIDEIVKRLEKVKNKIHTSFVVDNLDFLARAGQVSRKTAEVTKSLMAKPVLVLKKGKMGVGKIYFGPRERVWKRYIGSVLRNPASLDKRLLFVTCVGLTKHDTDKIREEIEKRAKFDAIYFRQASPAISVNCGPGTFGLLVRDKDKGFLG